MTTVVVDGRPFTFPASTTVTKHDGWTYYREFQSLGVKAVDLVVMDDADVLWLVEVKDYTRPGSGPAPLSMLPTTVASKCRDTLAGLAAARFRASGQERVLADRAMRSQILRVVPHVDPPTRRGGLFLRAETLADLQKKLRAEARSMDTSSRVHDRFTQFPGWTTP